MKRLSSNRTAFVSGLGVLSPIGSGVESFWQAIQSGKSSARPIKSFDTSEFRTHIGCEVRNRQLNESANDQERSLPRASRLAAVAARNALEDSLLTPNEVDALIIGTTSADLPEIEDRLLSAHQQSESQNWVHRLVRGSFSRRVATAIQIEAPAQTVVTACAAGNLAISRGLDLIRSGAAERVLVGGADAFSRLAFIGFSRLRGMASEACQPFDTNRGGMLLGEGAAFLMLESEASLSARGAKPRAQILGYGLSCDAHHVAVPAPDGRGATQAIRRALSDSGVDATEVDYVSAHGTGTKQNDLAESKACNNAFSETKPFVSSLKALTGHCLGAASAIEAAACVLSLQQQKLIPAWNIEDLDPNCDVNVPLPNTTAVDQKLSIVASNAFAFGGNNSCVMFAEAC